MNKKVVMKFWIELLKGTRIDEILAWCDSGCYKCPVTKSIPITSLLNHECETVREVLIEIANNINEGEN